MAVINGKTQCSKPLITLKCCLCSVDAEYVDMSESSASIISLIGFVYVTQSSLVTYSHGLNSICSYWQWLGLFYLPSSRLPRSLHEKHHYREWLHKSIGLTCDSAIRWGETQSHQAPSGLRLMMCSRQNNRWWNGCFQHCPHPFFSRNTTKLFKENMYFYPGYKNIVTGYFDGCLVS